MKHAKYWLAALAALIVGGSHMLAHKIAPSLVGAGFPAQINLAGTTVFVASFLVFLFLPRGGSR